MLNAAIIELGLFERMLPLVGGYLQAYASKDPWIRSSYKFHKRSAVASKVNFRTCVAELINLNADVYAFSCYVWNIGYVKSIVRELASARPSAHIILGGPEVMHQGSRYLDPLQRNIAVCNGEGERIFADYLRELTEPAPDYSKIAGITYFREGIMEDTPGRGRLMTLDEIPSPHLTGVFEPGYTSAVFETNRGCPFRCAFCFWGAATNDRVYRFSEDRIQAEIEWFGKKGIYLVYIADANWGMLPRDVEFTRHFVHSKQAHQAPVMLLYSGAKNSPARVTEINQILRAADIITSQPISLQSLDQDALRAVDRQNIKTTAYVQVQEQLTSLGISSYTELIWPLPGETLSSFEAGIGKLCRMGTTTIIVYPHLLLVNTPMYNHQKELGLAVETLEDGIGRAEVVVATNDVCRSDCFEGMRYFYSMFLLHNLRGLCLLGGYLDRTGLMNYELLFTQFANFCRFTDNCEICRFVNTSIESLAFVDQFNYGKLIHLCLHQERLSFERLIAKFVEQCGFFEDEAVRFLYELDRLLLPYVYSSTPLSLDPGAFQIIAPSVTGPRSLSIGIPPLMEELCSKSLAEHRIANCITGGKLTINHARAQHPYMKSQTVEHNAGYCHGLLIRTDTMMPTCVAPAHR
jgi:tRNA A37 methylthiotransferase MiaB